MQNTEYSIIDKSAGGRSKVEKSNGVNGTWKVILLATSFLLTWSMSIGGMVASYYKGMIETDNKLHTLQMEQHSQYSSLKSQLQLMDENVCNQLEWNSQSIELLAREVPKAVEKHEYHMHPKEAYSSSSPTKIEITLPSKPKKSSIGWGGKAESVIGSSRMVAEQ